LAAAYIAEHLRAWGVKPGGDNGSYFQRVKVLSVKSTNNSTLTVEVGGQTRTFKNGEGITFPSNIGGKRRFTADQVEFLGYGLDAPMVSHNDYEGKDVKGKVVVWLGNGGPGGLDPQLYRRALSGRNRYATDQRQAVASIGPIAPPGGRGGGQGRQGGQPGGQGGPGGQGRQGGANAQAAAFDFTTAQRLDHPIAPSVSAGDEFFEFLFSNAQEKYAELKDKAAKQEPLPDFTLKGVKLTFNLDADYQITNTQYTRNVVGIIEGTDARLKDTYVTFGAH
jgi:hypothetical protein